MFGYMDNDEMIIELLKAILQKLDNIEKSLDMIEMNTSNI